MHRPTSARPLRFPRDALNAVPGPNALSLAHPGAKARLLMAPWSSVYCPGPGSGSRDTRRLSSISRIMLIGVFAPRNGVCAALAAAAVLAAADEGFFLLALVLVVLGRIVFVLVSCVAVDLTEGTSDPAVDWSEFLAGWTDWTDFAEVGDRVDIADFGRDEECADCGRDCPLGTVVGTLTALRPPRPPAGCADCGRTTDADFPPPPLPLLCSTGRADFGRCWAGVDAAGVIFDDDGP